MQSVSSECGGLNLPPTYRSNGDKNVFALRSLTGANPQFGFTLRSCRRARTRRPSSPAHNPAGYNYTGMNRKRGAAKMFDATRRDVTVNASGSVSCALFFTPHQTAAGRANQIRGQVVFIMGPSCPSVCRGVGARTHAPSRGQEVHYMTKP